MDNFLVNNTLALSIDDKMRKDLDSFLATNTQTDINRQVYLIKPLRDKNLKVTTCLVFDCHPHSFEEPTVIECKYTGCVLYIPAFWVEVPKELAFTYICELIDSIYSGIYTTWYQKGLIGGIGSSGGNSGTTTPGINNGCGCNPQATWNPI